MREECSFLKKRTKRLLRTGCSRAVDLVGEAGAGTRHKSLFASFSSEKEDPS
jgi:hypothetical protein